jgi:phosphoribosyl 1,2-cyclic phosphodiesterase
VNVRFWGTRGSLPTPGPHTARYGGNTSCVEVQTDTEPTAVVALDGGTGICRFGGSLGPEVRRLDLLLTHLHMDHIIGLGFCPALFRTDLEVHIWGPPSPAAGLRDRLSRYLSPPLFPVRLRDLPSRPVLHDLALNEPFELPGLTVVADLVCHPGPTAGYRLSDGTSTLAYISDHEPALGGLHDRRWTSGYDLAKGATLLVHDAQYTDAEYEARIGWGHSTIAHVEALAELAGVERTMAFHHDPGHDDEMIDAMYEGSALQPAREGDLVVL